MRKILALIAIAIFCIGIAAYASPNTQNTTKSPASCSMETCKKGYTKQKCKNICQDKCIKDCKTQKGTANCKKSGNNCNMQSNKNNMQKSDNGCQIQGDKANCKKTTNACQIQNNNCSKQSTNCKKANKTCSTNKSIDKKTAKK